jgi:rhamnogalacturonan endolyase
MNPNTIHVLLAASAFQIAGAASSMPAAEDAPAVVLKDEADKVILSNGIITATIDKAASTITSMKFGAYEMVSDKRPVYYSMGGGSSYRQPTRAEFRVVRQSPEIADVAFLQRWKPGNPQAVDIEVHFVLKRGESGVHSYAKLSHPAAYPDSSVGEWRMVWGMPKLNENEWLLEKIRVDRQRDWEMPSPADLAKAEPTEIAEIVAITQGVRAGKFDCKYDYNLEYYGTGCWGFASDRRRLGAWIVLGSHEFFNDGPLKQDLSSASGIIHLHFGMNHYNGSSTRLSAGQDWQKIYGPFLLYCNQGGTADELWADAHAKAAAERRAWPHAWVEDRAAYPPRAARGTVRGNLSVADPLKPQLTGAGAWVGLSQPEPGGNWQMESNHYQYWTKADANGAFEIPHVRPGTYTLSAFTTGAVGEYEKRGVVVAAGDNRVEPIVWNIPRLGKNLAWEIGVPDRRAAEFRHGDDYFRGYVWKEFSKEFPNPLIYEVGKSNPARDWNFAHGSYLKDGRNLSWPWEIRFELAEVPKTGQARLQFSWAGSDRGAVNVVVNGSRVTTVTPPVSGGNALLREGIHAKYCHNDVDFPTSLLRQGANTITLTQTSNRSAGWHVMYDSLALELP